LRQYLQACLTTSPRFYLQLCPRERTRDPAGTQFRQLYFKLCAIAAR
jgi:hypothetical protein